MSVTSKYRFKIIFNKEISLSGIQYPRKLLSITAIPFTAIEKQSFPVVVSLPRLIVYFNVTFNLNPRPPYAIWFRTSQLMAWVNVKYFTTLALEFAVALVGSVSCGYLQFMLPFSDKEPGKDSLIIRRPAPTTDRSPG